MAIKTKAKLIDQLTPEQAVIRIQRLRREGVSNAAIAAELGIGLATVYRLVPAKQNGKAPSHSTVEVKPAKATRDGADKIATERAKATVVAKAKAPAKAPKAKVDNGVGVADIAVVKAADLHRWLSDVQPFRGYDDTLPMLTGTHVEWDGKRFLAATTDRFTLGISKLDVPDTGVTSGSIEDVDFMLTPNDVASILRIAKTAKKDWDWRMVTISRVGEIPAGCTVPTFTYRFAFFSGESLTVKPFDVEFPKIKQLIPPTWSGNKKELPKRNFSAFTNEYLVKFARVANDRAGRIRFYTFDDSTEGGAKPTAVLIGESFVGLIMPVRCPDDAGWVKPGWLS